MARKTEIRSHGKPGYTFWVDGVRIGSDAEKRIVKMRHPLGGSIVQLAFELSMWAAEKNRLPSGEWRPARRSAEVRDLTRVKPRVTINALMLAEEYYSSHAKVPSDATLAAMVATLNGEGRGRELLDELMVVKSDHALPVVSELTRDAARARREERARVRAEG